MSTHHQGRAKGKHAVGVIREPPLVELPLQLLHEVDDEEAQVAAQAGGLIIRQLATGLDGQFRIVPPSRPDCAHQQVDGRSSSVKLHQGTP